MRWLDTHQHRVFPERTLAALLGALVLAGCGGARPKLDDSTLAGRRIDDVDIDGNDEFSDSEIIAGLAHRPRDGWVFRSYTYYDPLALRVDRRRVAAFYHERGYFNAAVASVAIERDGEDIDLRFRVNEGEATEIGTVEIEGIVGPLRDRLLAIAAGADIEPGERFRHPVYLETKVLLRRAVLARGYARAHVDGRVEVDRDTRQARVIYTVTPGQLYRFGDVVVDGNKIVPSSVVLERIDWERDDLFSPEALDRTRIRLLELRVFNSVRLDYATAGGGTDLVNITVKVSEGNRNLLKLGGGVLFDPTRLEVRAIARYTRKGVLDPLTNLRSEVRPGYVLLSTEDFENQLTFEGLVGLERIDFLFPRVRLRATTTVEREIAEAYTSLGPGLRLSLDRPFLRDRLRVSAGWVFRYLFSFEPEDAILAAALGVEEPYRLGYYEQSAILDLRDQPILPRSGFYAAARAEQGTAGAAGAFEYLRFLGEVRAYLPVNQRLVLAFRAAGGILRSRGSEPVTQRFYSGSANHRGFGFRRLSPFAIDESGEAEPLGGAGLAEASGEFRFRITTLKSFPVRLVFFVDAGDVREQFADIDFARPHVAVGFGFRWDLPIGPLRFDLGRRVNRIGAMESDGTLNPDPNSPWAFHFGLGEAF
jgi:translocation and assembly module TamA